MDAYTRRVFFYETDQMGVVHHSNYIRWMEEARLDYMRKICLDYTLMEDAGIIMPVVSVDCRYRVSAHFDEQVYITVTPTGFNGVRTIFSYRLLNARGILLADGNSEHCFLGKTMQQPLNLWRRMPEFCAQLDKYVVRQR